MSSHKNTYSPWSKHYFADATIVETPGRMIYLSGVGAEDPIDGHVHHPGDCASQTRMAYDKIRTLLAEHGANFSHIVRLVAYLTDLRRDFNAYESEKRRAFAGFDLPPHTLLGISSLAFPEMVVEVQVTAVVPYA